MANPLTLATAPALRILRLNLLLRVDDSTSFIPWLVSLLAGARGLTDIVLIIYTGRLRAPIVIDWAPVDAVRLNIPGLCRLSLEFLALLLGTEEYSRVMAENAKRGLPGLVEMGVLKWVY
ncbi:hypothetical protein B0H17DRAFT_1207556 [Mycena rosella]|uniref:Uncharacterized protein n=1 Tax=Mycena rosella TaxID=1033263 RepID=A0AAD7G7S3_MYCRO|nr:hypothetical protein B0H17DRAFT_1207556 [Mycena rosella]